MENTLGKRIVARRKQLGLTQDQLAEQLGVTAQAVSKWEDVQSCPDIATLPKLAALLSVSVDALLGCETPAKEAEVVTEPEENNTANNTWEFHWDSGRKSGLLFAFGVLTVGVLTLLSKVFSWNGVDFWDIMWPTALIYWGIGELTKRSTVFGTALMVSGLFFLVDNLQFFKIGFGWELLLPVLLVVWGISLLLDALKKPKKGGFKLTHNGKLIKNNSHVHAEGDRFDCAVSFAERQEQINLECLSHGEITVSFGDATIDLTGCRDFAADCSIDASCSFGELTLIVPKTCRVENEDGTSAFSDTSFCGHHDPDATKIIHLRSTISFGELNVKYV